MTEWYRAWFGDEYLRIYAHRDHREALRQVNFLREVTGGLPSPAVVLDLCCGAGRHAVEMAAAGNRVVGADLSPVLLREARVLGRGRNVTLLLVRSDMRALPFGPVFDLVVNFFTSFGYFETDEENSRILEAICSVLRPGGRFLIDYLNPDRVRSTLEPETRSSLEEGGSVLQRRWINEERQRVEKEIVIRPDSGPEERFRESVRLYSEAEMTRMLETAGLTLSTIYGDFSATEPFEPAHSPRMVIVGSKQDGIAIPGKDPGKRSESP